MQGVFVSVKLKERKWQNKDLSLDSLQFLRQGLDVEFNAVLLLQPEVLLKDLFAHAAYV